MNGLPLAFLERMQQLLGAEYDNFIASYEKPPSIGLRINTLKIAPEEFLRLSPIPLSPIPWSPVSFQADKFDPGQLSLGKHPYHAAGLYYLQDPSATLVAELLDPQPGEKVLDITAAPGGKTTHLAAKMRNQGLLVANEIHPRRAWDLAENLERCGVRNAIIINETPERLAKHFGAYFDRVLVDAPCSGEGLFRKNPAARSEWSPNLIKGCAIRQTTILAAAARLVRPGGWLAYTTCTFAPEENEGTLTRFLETHSEFDLVEPPLQPGIEPGRLEWAGPKAPETLNLAVRLWPHRAPGEGHFIAILRSRGSSPKVSLKPWNFTKIPRQLLRHFQDFSQETLYAPLEENNLALVGSYLYNLPAVTPGLDGLRLVHPGWWLGAFKKNRFEPSHALAMTMHVKDFRFVASLSMQQDDLVYAYLRGENLDAVGIENLRKGWLVVDVDGFPLGWGKMVERKIKNYYPRGLRWV